MRITKLLSVLLLALSLVQCGGGGGGTSVTLPATNLKGTYHLESFEVIYQDGFMFDQADFPHWSGVMKVSANSVTTMYDFDGDISNDTDLYTIQYDDQEHDSGVITFGDGSSSDFGCEGYKVEVFFDGFEAPHGNYIETDVWKKVSDSF